MIFSNELFYSFNFFFLTILSNNSIQLNCVKGLSHSFSQSNQYDDMKKKTKKKNKRKEECYL